ncbi:hypothetical protein NG895_27690 [Aeoliella sp. ICT_H6.2]|uniref:Inner membrane protein n=1 Tax=Aeoliella straminimaris TaxID=2954799 RepID=A0A9X2FID1_9BACT|nr:hypothetical protein [Aeoliella straminimaris]MCO6047704.1 hypothetical protein [Aeoliella straminimaris]
MNDWTLLGSCVVGGLLAGLVLSLLLWLRFKKTSQRLAGTLISVTWYYHLAGTIMFAAMALMYAHFERPAFAIFFALGSAINVYSTIVTMIRERAQFGFRHVLMAVTCVAILAACYRWFGIPVVVGVMILADAVVLGLAYRAWKRSGPLELPAESD